MPDPLTPERLDAIRARVTMPRLGISFAREMDRDIIAIRDLLAEVERLRASEYKARAGHDSIRRRLRLLTDDESWWIGGAWGDYGEVVIPIRAIHMVLGDRFLGDIPTETPELDPGLAATYRDLRATVEDLTARLDAVRALHVPLPDGHPRAGQCAGCTDGDWDYCWDDLRDCRWSLALDRAEVWLPDDQPHYVRVRNGQLIPDTTPIPTTEAPTHE